MAYAKANQTKLQFTSSGIGGSNYLACMLLNSTIGIKVTHVPYRNVVQAMQDVIAGRIDYTCLSLPLALPQITANTVKAIAILSKSRAKLCRICHLRTNRYRRLRRAELVRAVPSRRHAAGDRSAAQSRAWGGADIPVVQQRLKPIGGDVVGPERRSPEYLAQFVAGEIKKWQAPIKASGVQLD